MEKIVFNLLVHVIKVHAQREITNSWQGTISNSFNWVAKKKDTKYDFSDMLNELYDDAISFASGEIFNGISEDKLRVLLDKELVILNCKMILHLNSSLT